MNRYILPALLDNDEDALPADWPDNYDEHPCYLQGCRACWSGCLTVSSNPYDHLKEPTKHLLWHKGFCDADDASDLG